MFDLEESPLSLFRSVGFVQRRVANPICQRRYDLTALFQWQSIDLLQGKGAANGWLDRGSARLLAAVVLVGFNIETRI